MYTQFLHQGGYPSIYVPHKGCRLVKDILLFEDMDNLLEKVVNILDDCLEDTELYNQLISLAVLLDQRVNNLGNQLIENWEPIPGG